MDKAPIKNSEPLRAWALVVAGEAVTTTKAVIANAWRAAGLEVTELTAAHPTQQELDAQIIQALSAGMSIEQWQSIVDVRIGSSNLLGRAIASGEETRIELVRRAVGAAIAAQAKQGEQQ